MFNLDALIIFTSCSWEPCHCLPHSLCA